MARMVALLRGVNVGGRNKLPMADLRSLFSSLGHEDVVTYVQSGNVVFTSAGAVEPTAIEATIARRFAIDTTVVLRSLAELERVLESNPYPAADPSHLHVGFLPYPPARDALRLPDLSGFAPEQATLVGCELYLHLPNGMGRAKLPPFLDRQLKVPTTVRNWNTVNQLTELARAHA